MTQPITATEIDQRRRMESAVEQVFAMMIKDEEDFKEVLRNTAAWKKLRQQWHDLMDDEASKQPKLIGVDTSSTPDLTVVDGKFYRRGERVLPCRKPPES